MKRELSLSNEQIIMEWKKVRNLLLDKNNKGKIPKEDMKRLTKGKTKADIALLTAMSLAFTEGMMTVVELVKTNRLKIDQPDQERIRYIG